MDEQKKKEEDIIYSKAVKAGQRIYYLDAKKNSKGDYYLSITESKKKISEEGKNDPVAFERHKIFIYKEDFKKFVDGLNDVVSYINKED